MAEQWNPIMQRSLPQWSSRHPSTLQALNQDPRNATLLYINIMSMPSVDLKREESFYLFASQYGPGSYGGLYLFFRRLFQSRYPVRPVLSPHLSDSSFVGPRPLLYTSFECRYMIPPCIIPVSLPDLLHAFDDIIITSVLSRTFTLHFCLYSFVIPPVPLNIIF